VALVESWRTQLDALMQHGECTYRGSRFQKNTLTELMSAVIVVLLLVKVNLGYLMNKSRNLHSAVP
jgi:hypothetical protein